MGLKGHGWVSNGLGYFQQVRKGYGLVFLLFLCRHLLFPSSAINSLYLLFCHFFYLSPRQHKMNHKELMCRWTRTWTKLQLWLLQISRNNLFYTTRPPSPTPTIFMSVCFILASAYLAKKISRRQLLPCWWVGGGWCEGVMYLRSPGRPTDSGLQLGKAFYSCSR